MSNNIINLKKALQTIIDDASILPSRTMWASYLNLRQQSFTKWLSLDTHSHSLPISKNLFPIIRQVFLSIRSGVNSITDFNFLWNALDSKFPEDEKYKNRFDNLGDFCLSSRQEEIDDILKDIPFTVKYSLLESYLHLASTVKLKLSKNDMDIEECMSRIYDLNTSLEEQFIDKKEVESIVKEVFSRLLEAKETSMSGSCKQSFFTAGQPDNLSCKIKPEYTD